MTRRLLTVVAAVTVLGAAAGAHAASGTVSGRFMFYQNQGSFCPTGRDCTGAMYPQSQFNANNPVAHVKVYVRNAATNGVIGVGSSDANGYFSVGWYSLTAVSQASLYWAAEHKDGRFAIRNSDGGSWILWTYPFAVGASTNAGTFTWGSAGAPNQIANVYDGAWRTWEYAFKYSNRMQSYFTGVEVRAFSSRCATSCAVGDDNRIYLDPNSAFSPQGRIAHEMGHIASDRASRDQGFDSAGDYCYPNQGSGCGWNLTAQEWSAAAFEEGLATFFGDVAFYWWNANAPTTCLVSAAACSANGFNTESSSGAAGGSCAAGENRWPVSVDRYLWDVYDARNDSESVQRPYYEFFDGINAFPNGRDNGEKEEPYCCFIGCWVCDPDGRSGVDFYWNFQGLTGVATNNPYWNNCGPVGD